MATVYANANGTAAQHVDTHKACKKQRDGVTRRAKKNLAMANKTSRITPEGYFPAEIEESDSPSLVDYFTVLHAPDAMALEFGHAPSGWFAGTDTKPPAAEHILTRAAIGGAVS